MLGSIVFIGPPGVAVADVAQQVADARNLPIYSPYDFSDERWSELGYRSTEDILAWAQGGAYASYRLLAEVRIRAIEAVLNESGSGLIVLPADFVVHDDPVLRASLTALLARASDVVALLPTPDMNENAVLLDAELTNVPDWSAVNEYWIRQPSNERLATHIVYTQGRNESETRDEILRLTSHSAQSPIVLIGPKLTGKTTIGRLLADALGVPQVSLDMVGPQYLQETDYDPAMAARIRKEEGIFAWLRYRRPYEAHIVERTLQGKMDCVIDFGGGHSVYEDEAHFARVKNALSDNRNVVLILPSPDKDESIQILKERFMADVASERKLQRLLVTDPSYEVLATHVIFTMGKTTEALCTEVLARLNV